MAPVRDVFRRNRGPVDDSPSVVALSGWIRPRFEDWSALSTLGAGRVAVVGDRGSIALEGRPVAVDFWIGAGDRWIFPSEEFGTVQRRVGGMPIVETRVRAGPGDVVLTCWADEPGDGRGRIVVQVDSELDQPVALAVVVRPFTARAPGRATTIRITGSTIVVDGVPLVVLPSAPGDSVVGSSELGDAADRLTDGLKREHHVDSDDGSATLAAVLPLTPGSARVIQIIDGRDQPSVAPAPLDRVLAGWRSHIEPAALVSFPGWPEHLWPSLVSGAIAAAAELGNLDAIRSPVDRSAKSRSALVAALAGVGLPGSASTIVERLLTDVEDGRLAESDWYAVAMACGALVDSAGIDALLTRHPESVVPVVAHTLATGVAQPMVEKLLRAVDAAAGDRAAADAALIQPVEPDPTRVDDLVMVGAELTHEQWAAWAASVESDAGPGRDAIAVARAMIAAARSSAGATQDPRTAIRAAAGSNWHWPIGEDADSHLGRASLAIAMTSTVARISADTVDIMPGYFGSWLGRPVDVTDLAVPGGRLSFAIRWHGPRPALLWQASSTADRSGRSAPLRLTCSRLDPAFETLEASGETLLAEPSWAPATRTGSA